MPVSSKVVGALGSLGVHLLALVVLAATGGGGHVDMGPMSVAVPVTLVSARQLAAAPVLWSPGATAPGPAPAATLARRSPRRGTRPLASATPMLASVAPAAVSAARTVPAPAPEPARVAPAVPATDPTAPIGPLRLTPDQARALRYQDSYPSLPDSVRLAGTKLRVMVDVCVSALGAVEQVSFDPDTSAPLARLLKEAIVEWRYYPPQVAGVAVPFCHQVRLEYRVP